MQNCVVVLQNGGLWTTWPGLAKPVQDSRTWPVAFQESFLKMYVFLRIYIVLQKDLNLYLLDIICALYRGVVHSRMSPSPPLTFQNICLFYVGTFAPTCHIHGRIPTQGQFLISGGFILVCNLGMHTGRATPTKSTPQRVFFPELGLLWGSY